MRTANTSSFQRIMGLAVLSLSAGLLNCNQAPDEKPAEQQSTVQGFTPGGQCPTPGSACFTAGYSADCFWESEPYDCECVPTGLYNAHNWLCYWQDGNGGTGGFGPAGSSGTGGFGPGGTGGYGPGGSAGVAGAPNPGSCFDHCGSTAETCWCDDSCEEFGDCCADKVDFCGDGNGGTGGFGPGGSGGFPDGGCGAGTGGWGTGGASGGFSGSGTGGWSSGGSGGGFSGSGAGGWSSGGSGGGFSGSGTGGWSSGGSGGFRTSGSAVSSPLPLSIALPAGPGVDRCSKLGRLARRAEGFA